MSLSVECDDDVNGSALSIAPTTIVNTICPAWFSLDCIEYSFTLY